MILRKYYIFNGKESPYIVYSNGDVFSTISNKFLIPYKHKNGYMALHLNFNGEMKHKSIHRLVAETFIPNPDNKPEVNHIDGNKENNRYTNLEWVTKKENHIHAYATGLHKPVTGEKVHFHKYTSDQINIVCKEIEIGKLSMKEIEKVSGVPVKTISEIRNRKIWKSISKNYKFKNKYYRQPSCGLTYEQNNKIMDISTNTNLSSKEICELIGINYTKKINKKIQDIRYRRNKMMNVQRLSKTLDKDKYFEEEFMYLWERGSE